MVPRGQSLLKARAGEQNVNPAHMGHGLWEAGVDTRKLWRLGVGAVMVRPVSMGWQQQGMCL